MVMMITTMKIMMMIMMVMSASAGPVPVSLGIPVSASWMPNASEDVTVLQPPYLGWGRSQPP